MADAVIAVSQGTKDDVLAHFDVPEERIAIIHNGIDTDEYRPQEATDALQRHGIDPSVPYVLFVGRITRQKGIVHLVRAIRHLDPGDRGRALRRRARHAGDRRRDGGGRQGGPGGQPERALDCRDGRQADGPPAVFARSGVCLPVGLRAVRDHQPRGDGVRDRGRRKRRGWHPGSRRRGRDGAAGAIRTRGRRVIRAPGSGRLRARPGGPDQRADGRRATPARNGRGGQAAGGGALRLGVDRAQDGGPVRVARSAADYPLGRGAVRPTNQGTNENAAGGRLVHPTNQIDPEHAVRVPYGASDAPIGGWRGGHWPVGSSDEPAAAGGRPCPRSRRPPGRRSPPPRTAASGTRSSSGTGGSRRPSKPPPTFRAATAGTPATGTWRRG